MFEKTAEKLNEDQIECTVNFYEIDFNYLAITPKIMIQETWTECRTQKISFFFLMFLFDKMCYSYYETLQM